MQWMSTPFLNSSYQNITIFLCDILVTRIYVPGSSSSICIDSDISYLPIKEWNWTIRKKIFIVGLLNSVLFEDPIYILSFSLPLLLHTIPISQFSAPREKGHLNVEHSHSNGHFFLTSNKVRLYLYRDALMFFSRFLNCSIFKFYHFTVTIIGN